MQLLEMLRSLFASAPSPIGGVVSGNEDILEGYTYSATMQLRTPLCILKAHDTFSPLSSGPPSPLSDEIWHGIWIPKLISKFDSLSVGATMSSDVGYIPKDGGDYLHFLIAVREVTESGADPCRIEIGLRDVLRQSGKAGTPYSRYIDVGDLLRKALPRTVDALPVPSPVRRLMLSAGLRTLESVQNATDSELLAFKGLGPKSVQNLRQFLSETSLDPTAERYLAAEFKRYAPTSGT